MKSAPELERERPVKKEKSQKKGVFYKPREEMLPGRKSKPLNEIQLVQLEENQGKTTRMASWTSLVIFKRLVSTNSSPESGNKQIRDPKCRDLKFKTNVNSFPIFQVIHHLPVLTGCANWSSFANSSQAFIPDHG